ncbi:zinc finger MYM-type protein 1-like [Aphis craccivora]|uniref:Zinc finger MYM-type protein 1-like n=1 Tax=Aphis craccivora TaxID=307492 RepID=A0A6G0VPN1_APHCR|nr:zinc finger MYM-type protein 1-like [Aphis craccivora]
MGYELDLKSDYPTDCGKFDEAMWHIVKRVGRWLFADRMSGKFNKEWIEGVSDWQHLFQSIQRHEASIQHLYASKVRSLWIKNQTIDVNIENQYSQKGLRGNEGSLKIKNPNEGNFLRTVNLLAEFDPVLNNIMNDEKQKIKYLSPLIQNEIIDILSSDLCRIICDDIRSSCFFSVIIDSTQDKTKEDQVSLIIRYTVVDYEKKHIEIRESFLGFFLLKKHGAFDYAELLQHTLSEYRLNIEKCRGQGYDGAAVMSGANSGVQKRILEIVPNATFVHSCSHNLNFVISDAAKSTREILSFFETVQDVYNFFSSSAPRWSQLALGEEESSKLRKITLKKVCATRWEAHHNALFSLKQRFVDILKAFTRVQLTSTKKDEINTATALKKKLESAEFVLLLCTWEKILKSLFVVSKILQSVSIDLQQAFELLKNAHAEISKLRDEYDTFVDNFKTVCKFWNVPFMFLHKRQRFATKFHDEFDSDKRLTVTEDNFKVTIFNPLIDTTFTKAQREIYWHAAEYLISNDLTIIFPDIFTSCCIFMTISVTSASAERSFSKLKLIKNYLRNTISQDRLNNIAVSNIERLNTS